MHTHVCFQVAFGGERAAADSTFERPLAGVSSVVHLQCRFARQNSVADDALVGIGQLVLNVVDQLLELGGFAGFADFNERLPCVVVASRTWKKIGVNVWIFGRIETARKTQW